MRRRLSYANITATLALVFAMSGGALAANHYLINSTKQISPKVLKKLKGNAGKAGPTGPAGTVGPTGKEGLGGKEGASGKEGKEGARGPSDVWQAGDGSASSKPPLSVSVPAGSYLVQAKTVVGGGEVDSRCELSGGSASDFSFGATETSGINQMTITNLETTVLGAPGPIKLECLGGATFFYAKLTATQVGTIH